MFVYIICKISGFYNEYFLWLKTVLMRIEDSHCFIYADIIVWVRRKVNILISLLSPDEEERAHLIIVIIHVK